MGDGGAAMGCDKDGRKNAWAAALDAGKLVGWDAGKWGSKARRKCRCCVCSARARTWYVPVLAMCWCGAGACARAAVRGETGSEMSSCDSRFSVFWASVAMGSYRGTLGSRCNSFALNLVFLRLPNPPVKLPRLAFTARTLLLRLAATPCTESPSGNACA
ncbi:hypothetical protein BCR44DRAFT_1436305 [Catenaria anguillulae PL171]|uniref:Uncharacterized protein n=1 Tax=Catenaria anguillulae PL171 TaxID=765915 RepID=A0A1Y2HIX8_9FUNG|nr:hypothetical protein BCR44DRAFT_1436305 [Catenaria anguillulae PL171]